MKKMEDEEEEILILVAKDGFGIWVHSINCKSRSESKMEKVRERDSESAKLKS